MFNDDIPSTETETRFISALDQFTDELNSIQLDAPESVDNDELVADLIALLSVVSNVRCDYR